MTRKQFEEKYLTTRNVVIILILTCITGFYTGWKIAEYISKSI